jgi:hypothetical protein
LIDRLLEKKDERCVAVLRDYKESGEMVSKGVEMRVRESFEAVDGSWDKGVVAGL